MSTVGSARTTVRMGFAIDAVGYGRRPAPEQVDVQRRLAHLFADVLRELEANPEETYRQDTGDGVMVFLPPGTEPRRALPRLLRELSALLNADNARHHDRLRIRVSVVMGSVGPAELGWSGHTVVAATRLVESAVLREALAEHPDSSLVALISSDLYDRAVGESHPGLDPAEFRPVEVDVKGFTASARLWVGSTAPAPEPNPRSYVLAKPHRSRCRLGVIAGTIRRVRTVAVWVNSENTDMEMSRTNESSISGIIRYYGARRDAGGHVVADAVADELNAQVASGRPVAPGATFVTGAGELTRTHNVRWIIHVAAVQGEPGQGYRPVRDVGACVTNALLAAERLARNDAAVDSIVFPLLGTGAAGAPFEPTVTTLVERAIDHLVSTRDTRLKAIYLLGYTVEQRVAIEQAFARHPDLRAGP